MTSQSPGVQPESGDYVVLYEPRTLTRTPRLALVRWTADAPPTLIRATFESAEVAGARFEDDARLMAAECRRHSFRGVDGRYTRLDVPSHPDGE